MRCATVKICKENIIPAIVAIGLVTFIWPITIKIGLTGSGKFSFYIFDLVMLGLCGYNLYGVVRDKKQYFKFKLGGCVEGFYYIILIEYVVCTVFRLINGYSFYNSFEMCFRTLAPLSLAIYIFKEPISFKVWLRYIDYAIAFINLYSVCIHLFVYKSVRSDFLMNVNMHAFFCLVGLFINSLAFYYQNKNWIYRVIFVFNMVYSLCIFCVVGSRATSTLGILATVLIIVVFAKKPYTKYYIIAGILAMFLVLIMWIFNFGGCRALMIRGFNLETIVGVVENEDLEKGYEDENEENISDMIDEDNAVKASLVSSDEARISFWSGGFREIKKEPIFGTGKVGVGTSKDGNQGAHNFILEYWLIYGGIGFMMWSVFVIVYLKNVVKASMKEKRRMLIFGLFGLLFVALGFSCFQVSMVTTFGSLMVWLGVFFYSASIIYSEE